MIGNRLSAQVDKCPSTNSRLISRPTKRKKIAINPSLIQRWTVIGPSFGDNVGPDTA